MYVYIHTRRYLGADVASGGEALSLLQGHVANAASLLATDILPKFVQTKACLPVVEEIVKGKGMRKSTELLWSQYEVRTCAQYMHACLQCV